MKLPDDDRRREEDPFTGDWARLVSTHVIGRRSRFEFDLNRPAEDAVYRDPSDAWGLDLWHEPPADEILARSRAEHATFYEHLDEIYRAKAAKYGKFVVLDLHSYNHRRDGPDGSPADDSGNPEINLGTGTMDRSRWGLLIDRFMEDLSATVVAGHHLDIRENVKFVGRHHGAWAHGTFPDAACVLSLEFKKTFMDEWTGELDAERHRELGQALCGTFPGLMESLRELGARC